MEFEFSVAGITHQTTDVSPLIGDEIQLLPFPLVTHPNAIKVLTSGGHIGWVPNNEKLDLAKEMCPFMEKFQGAQIVEFKHKDDEGWNTEGRGKLHYVKVKAQFDVEDKNFKTYEKDGIQFARISSIVSAFTPDGFDFLIKWAYSKASTYPEYQQVMLKYQIDGTNNHLLMEKYFKNEIGIEALPTGAQSWLNKHEVVPIQIEDTLYDYSINVAGTFDFFGTVDGVPEIVDWKSSKAVKTTARWQVAFYTKNHTEAERGRVVAFGAENKRGYSESIIKDEKLDGYYEMIQHVAKAYNLLKG